MGYDDYGGYAALSAMLALFGFVLLIVAVLGYVLSSIFMMKIFEKAGVDGKWRAWVPVYREMVFFKLGDMSPWLVLYTLGATILLAPTGIGSIIGLAFTVFFAMAGWRVGLKLQKEGAWVVLFVLLNIVWMGILAFDRSRWNDRIPPAPWAQNGFLADRTVWDGVPTQSSAVAPGAGYGAPHGYQPPAAPGYPSAGYPPAGYSQPGQPQPGQPEGDHIRPDYTQPGFAPPAQPGFGAPQSPGGPGTPVPPAPGSPVPPPATPPVPPAPPAGPPSAPPAPPAPPSDPDQNER